MKKKLLKICILVVMLFINSFYTVNAETTKITASGSTVDSGKEITVTIKSSVSLAGYTVSLKSSGDCSFKSVTVPSGVTGSPNGSTIGGMSTGGTKTLATYKFKAPTVTADKKSTIEFEVTGMLSANDEELSDTSAKATINIKAPVVEEPEPKPEPKPEPEPEPTVLEFTSVKETVYATGTVNVRESYSASSERLGQLKEGDNVTRTGVSKTTDEQGNKWSKITYNGKTAYVISSKLTTTKPTVEEPEQEEPIEEPEDDEPEIVTTEPTTNVDAEVKAGLASLEIEGLTLSPTFSPDIYEYRVIVKEDFSELKINAVARAEGSNITIAGNENLQEGENLILIMVYNAKDEAEATYQITTNKSTLDLTETDKILKTGTEEARRNLIIFAVLLGVAIIALVVVIILKRRNGYYKEDYEGDYQESGEFTGFEQSVENIDEENSQAEIRSRARREKRKGKHF